MAVITLTFSSFPQVRGREALPFLARPLPLHCPFHCPFSLPFLRTSSHCPFSLPFIDLPLCSVPQYLLAATYLLETAGGDDSGGAGRTARKGRVVGLNSAALSPSETPPFPCDPQGAPAA